MPHSVPLAPTPNGTYFAVMGAVWPAALIVAIIFVVSRVWGPAPFDEIVASAADAPRTVEGRLTGGFVHAPLEAPTRSAGPAPPPWPILAAAAHAQESINSDPSAVNLHVFGVSALAAGHHDDAVQALEDAAAADGARAAVHSDLAAAYLAREAATGQAIDLPRAIAAANRASRLDGGLAEARYNYALALERLHLRHEAARAWGEYLERFAGDAGWAQEASAHREALQGTPPAAPPSPAHVAEQVLDEWAAAAATDPVGAHLPDIQSPDPYHAAVVAEVRRAGARERVALAAGLRDLRAAELALVRGNASAVDGAALAALAARLGPASPFRLWAQRLQLSIGFAAGRTIEVRDGAHRLLEEAEARGYRALEADARLRLASLDYTSGAYDAALAGYEATLRLRQAIGDPRGAASAHLAAAEAYRMLGREAEAWDHYVALIASPSVAGPTVELGRLTSPAVGALNANMPAVALALSNEAVHVVAPYRQPSLTAEAWFLHARALSRLGDRAAATGSLRLARQTAEQITAPPARNRMLAEVAFSEAELWSTYQPEAAITAAAEAEERFLASSAHQRLLLLSVITGRAHRTRHDIASARAALIKGTAIVESQRDRIARRDFVPSFVDASWDVYSELVDLEATEGDTAAALRWLDRGLGTPGPMPAPAAVSWAASRDRPLLAFLARPDALWVFVVRDGAVRQRRIPVARDSLQAAISRVNQLVTQGHSAALDPALRRLASQVWWPAAAMLADGAAAPTRVALVVDPVLQRVPWVLLPWSPTTPDRIIDVASPVQCAALTGCGVDAGPAVPTSRVMALYGHPGGEGLPPLASARAEAEEIGRKLGNAAAVPATAAALAAALADADVVHFSGHAIANERYPGRSELLLVDDSGAAVRVPVSQMLTAPARASLVVLSACRTGRAEARRGAGATGIAGEFLRAGVAHVVATQWDVRDDAASSLMSALYDALAAGETIWDAVRTAQLIVSRTRPPRDWAGYVAYATAMARAGNQPRVGLSESTTRLERP